MRTKLGLDRVYKLETDDFSCKELDQLRRTLNMDPAVEYAEFDYKVEPMADFNDRFLHTNGSEWDFNYSETWALDTVNARAAWDQATGKGVAVVRISL